MMNEEMIVDMILSILPSIIAIATTLGTILKTLKDFKDLKKDVTDMKDIEDLKDQISILIQQNLELKKQLNETLTKIDHVERK